MLLESCNESRDALNHWTKSTERPEVVMSPCLISASSQIEKAPVYFVSGQRIVSVEHPGIVRNIDKAVQSLGGESELSQVCMPPSTRNCSRILTD